MTSSARVVTLGETLALLHPRELGSLRHVGELALGVGGAESNVAIGLRRLGVEVSWLGRVGADALGERVVRELRGEGLDVRAVEDPDAPTAIMIKERPRATSTAVYYYRSGSAGSRLAPADLPADWVEAAELLHLTGITPLLSDAARDTAWAALERARAAEILVSFDVNYRSALAAPELARERLRPFAERADLVFGGEEELQLLTDAPTAAAAAAELLEARCTQVVAKQGAAGATVFASHRQTVGPGYPVDVVDTVGAGDAFVAGYLSAQLAGLSVAERLRRGNACGALLCSAPGDWEASPTERELARFLAPAADPVAR